MKDRMSYPLLENQTEVLEYLRGRFPMFHNSNLFFRDFQYGIQQFLNARGDHVGYAEAETRAREFCGALERQGILIPIDGQTWTLNYPPFKTPERKKPAEPPKPVPKPAAGAAQQPAAKPEKPGTA